MPIHSASLEAWFKLSGMWALWRTRESLPKKCMVRAFYRSVLGSISVLKAFYGFGDTSVHVERAVKIPIKCILKSCPLRRRFHINDSPYFPPPINRSRHTFTSSAFSNCTQCPLSISTTLGSLAHGLIHCTCIIGTAIASCVHVTNNAGCWIYFRSSGIAASSLRLRFAICCLYQFSVGV